MLLHGWLCDRRTRVRRCRGSRLSKISRDLEALRSRWPRTCSATERRRRPHADHRWRPQPARWVNLQTSALQMPPRCSAAQADTLRRNESVCGCGISPAEVRACRPSLHGVTPGDHLTSSAGEWRWHASPIAETRQLHGRRQMVSGGLRRRVNH